MILDVILLFKKDLKKLYRLKNLNFLIMNMTGYYKNINLNLLDHNYMKEFKLI